jgi:hypothetical protein
VRSGILSTSRTTGTELPASETPISTPHRDEPGLTLRWPKGPTPTASIPPGSLHYSHLRGVRDPPGPDSRGDPSGGAKRTAPINLRTGGRAISTAYWQCNPLAGGPLPAAKARMTHTSICMSLWCRPLQSDAIRRPADPGYEPCTSRVVANTTVAPLFIGAYPPYRAVMQILTQRDRVDGEMPPRARARIAGSAIAAPFARFADWPASAGVPGHNGLEFPDAGKFLPTQSLSVVGLFELPRKLPIPIARCDGTAWRLLSAHEPGQGRVRLGGAPVAFRDQAPNGSGSTRTRPDKGHYSVPHRAFDGGAP